MFDNLSERLTGTLKGLMGRGRLTEDNIEETLREVRKALLEADVALPIAKQFVARVQEKAVGQKVIESLTPGQMLVKIVQAELVSLMGEANDSLDLKAAPPVVILMAGLQGAGKTTSVAKLARWLQERAKKSVMVVSTDVYRPAAIDQLETLSNQVGATFWPSTPAQKPVDIAQEAVQAARTHVMDVLIIDTAGRLHIDDEMMLEIKQLHEVVRPTETLFVVDAMTGQDAVNTAKVFNDALPLTGVILTKADGDARGGAALSVKAVTGKPIKFLGVGEKNDALEPFYPDRMASRILGMGDVLTLVEEAERKLDKKKADRLASKLKKGRGFDLEDMLEQFQQMKKMGGIASMLDKLPGMGGLAKMASAANSEGTMKQVEAIILSMTIHERRFPDVISGSRKRRIAAGSGMEIQDVNRLLKQYKQMQKVMKKFGKKGGMKSIMRSMEGMMGGGGGLPPGFGR
ncbi:MAG: signal recognition particle protein [Gammaproteobacteria bacterium]